MIQLPAGVRAIPVRLGLDNRLAGVRVTRYRYDLLDNDENLLGTMTSVQSGSLDWSSFTAIKGSGTCTVKDRGQGYDWLNLRIRPTAILDTTDEHPLGVFIPSAPVEDWDDTGRVWNLELLDKNSLLDQDVAMGSDGNPVTYTVAAGANILGAVATIIQGIGESAAALTPSAAVLAAPMVWETGTTLLRIVNDLLEAAGYSSLWCDGMGQYRADPYVSPRDRVPVYEDLAPFHRGDTSLMSPQMTRDRDIYSIPNRYVAVSAGTDTAEALVAVATNTDPASPFSYPSRGRWITRTSTGVEAASQAELDARAKMGLAQASSVQNGLALSHQYLPELGINNVITFVNGDLNLLCYVTKMSVPLDPTALCKSEIQEAVV